MATQNERRIFFSNRPNTQTITTGGNSFKFANLSKDAQTMIRKRLAAKDDVMAQGLKGILPGIKIDGKTVTKDNIKDFEISKTETQPKTVAKKKPKFTYSEEGLLAMTFKQLRKIGDKLSLKFRGKAEAVKEILEATEE